MNDDTLKPSRVKRGADLLAMSLGELLQFLIARSVDPDPWVEVRHCEVPYRELLAAIKRGELRGSKIGRKVFVRRTELDRWIDSRGVRIANQGQLASTTTSSVEHILEAAGYRKAGAQ